MIIYLLNIPLSARAFFVTPWATTVVGTCLTTGTGGMGAANGTGNIVAEGDTRIGMAVCGNLDGTIGTIGGGSPTGITGATVDPNPGIRVGGGMGTLIVGCGCGGLTILLTAGGAGRDGPATRALGADGLMDTTGARIAISLCRCCAKAIEFW